MVIFNRATESKIFCQIDLIVSLESNIAHERALSFGLPIWWLLFGGGWTSTPWSMMSINVKAVRIAGLLQPLRVGTIRKRQNGWVRLARIPTARLRA